MSTGDDTRRGRPATGAPVFRARTLAVLALALAAGCVPVPAPEVHVIGEAEVAPLAEGERIAVIAGASTPREAGEAPFDAAACLESRLAAALPPGAVVSAAPVAAALAPGPVTEARVATALGTPALRRWAERSGLRAVLLVEHDTVREGYEGLVPGPVAYRSRRDQLSVRVIDLARAAPPAVVAAEGEASGGIFAPLLVGVIVVPTGSPDARACGRLAAALAEDLRPR